MQAYRFHRWLITGRDSAVLCCAVVALLPSLNPDLEQELVLGKALDRFQQVRVQPQFVLQFSLALLATQKTEQQSLRV